MGHFSTLIYSLMVMPLILVTGQQQEPPPLGTFPKVSTQYDGYNFDHTITYLALDSNLSARLPLVDC